MTKFEQRYPALAAAVAAAGPEAREDLARFYGWAYSEGGASVADMVRIQAQGAVEVMRRTVMAMPVAREFGGLAVEEATTLSPEEESALESYGRCGSADPDDGRDCENCRHVFVEGHRPPCNSCRIDPRRTEDHWEAKEAMP